jgi:tRNA-dihydrouridine synthase 2
MGAGLLKDKEKIKNILTNLVNNIKKPVTCKIRLLEDEKETIELVKMIENCGVSALAIHCR